MILVSCGRFGFITLIPTFESVKLRNCYSSRNSLWCTQLSALLPVLFAFRHFFFFLYLSMYCCFSDGSQMSMVKPNWFDFNFSWIWVGVNCCAMPLRVRPGIINSLYVLWADAVNSRLWWELLGYNLSLLTVVSGEKEERERREQNKLILLCPTFSPPPISKARTVWTALLEKMWEWIFPVTVSNS